jgi:ParD-like antitoxin of type II bacterial toxin-antitoxin system
MGQPVKLSDALVLDARVVGEAAERSIASQIEYWARVGKAVEPMLRGDEVLRLKQRGEAVALSELLKSVDSKAGQERVRAHLSSRPFPHFEPAPGRAGLLVKIDEDGKRTVGRFVNREFRPAGRK